MESIFQQILSMSFTSSIVILVVLVVRFFLKKSSRNIACILWLLVALRLVLPITFESSFSLMPRNVVSDYVVSTNTKADKINNKQAFKVEANTNEGNDLVVTDSENRNSNHVTEIANSNVVDDAIKNDIPVIQQSDKTNESETTKFSAMEILSIVWISGAAMMGLYGVISSVLLKRKVSASIACGDGIYVCDAVETPFVFGVFSPRIYIPSNLSDDVASYVVKHEMAHLKRGDNLWKMVAFILLSIYWFNPLVWISFVMFERDIELACDERVISNMDLSEKKGYANALLICSMHKKVMLSYPLYFGEIGLKERVKAVKNYKKAAISIIAMSVVICVAVAGCFLTDPKTDETEVTDSKETEVDVSKTEPESVALTETADEKNQDEEVVNEKLSEYEEMLKGPENAVQYNNEYSFEAENVTITPIWYTYNGYYLNFCYEVAGDDSTTVLFDSPMWDSYRPLEHYPTAYFSSDEDNKKLICETIENSYYFPEFNFELIVSGTGVDDEVFEFGVVRQNEEFYHYEMSEPASTVFNFGEANLISVDITKKSLILMFDLENGQTRTTMFGFTLVDDDGNEFSLEDINTLQSTGFVHYDTVDQFLMMAKFYFNEDIPLDISKVHQINLYTLGGGELVTINWNE